MVPLVSGAGFPHPCPSPPTSSPGPRLPGARGSCPQTCRWGMKSLWKLRASTHITPESPCTNLHPGSSALSPVRSREPCPVRAHESRGDPGEHLPCLLPLSPAPHGWAPGATPDALVKDIALLCCSVASVHFSLSVVSDSLRPHEMQHARPPCPLPTPGVHLVVSNSLQHARLP